MGAPFSFFLFTIDSMSTTQDSSLLENISKNLTNAGSTFTENGAPTYDTSGNCIVDMFDSMGGLRHEPSDILPIFNRAWDEDPLAALKLTFLLRNPRGGMGERRLFDVIIKHLCEAADPLKRASIEQNLPLLEKYGRWDDLLTVVEYGNAAASPNNPTLSRQAVLIIQNQLNKDKEALRTNMVSDISLLAKWLPSDNASSKSTKTMARKLASLIGLKVSDYRKTLVSLRKALGDAVVETKMSSKEFDNIDYSKVCSKASLLYRNAFKKRDESRYNRWVEDVAAGKSKVNAGTLHPHEVAWKALQADEEEAQQLQNIWDALPDYGMEGDALPVIDVSPSMTFETISADSKITPLVAGLGLGTYLAQRNQGRFKGHFMTFDDKPQLQKLEGDNIVETMQSLKRHDGAGYSTNIQAVFDCILESADKAEDLPEYIYILTDCEFDSPSDHTFDGSTNHEVIKAKFDAVGFPMPKLVYWNLQRRLDGRANNIAMKENDYGLVCSGFSPAMLEPVMQCEIISPRAIVEEALKPYDDVELPVDYIGFDS